MTRNTPIDLERLSFRLGKPDDVRPLLDKYAQSLFDEAGFGAFAELDIERAEREMTREVVRGIAPCILAAIDGETVGWISYSLIHVFTVRPIAHAWMIYVTPEHRRGVGRAIARMLVMLAAQLAIGDGACAFFAEIPLRSMRLGNLFRHCGFEPTGGAFFRRL
jgi:ribosomal protein S18 acetylase RimI-like enzyme